MPHTLAKIVLPVFAAFAFFAYPVHFAFAYEEIGNSATDAQWNYVSDDFGIQLGSGYTGTIGAVTVQMHKASAGNVSAIVFVNNTSYPAVTVSVSSGTTSPVFDFSSLGISLLPSDVINIDFLPASGSIEWVGSYATQSYQAFCADINTNCTPNFWPYFSTIVSRAAADAVQSIRFTSPLNGTQVNAATTSVTVAYVNPNNYTQLQYCFYNPDTLAALSGSNPCDQDSFSASASSYGTTSFTYTNTASTSHMILTVAFGPSFDYIPGGTPFVDYDSVSLGFYTAAVTGAATGTPDGQSPYAGLDCGGFNLFDNYKCFGIFLFHPDPKLTNELRAISFASTSPFGYVPAIRDLYTGFASTSSSTVISVNLRVFSTMFPTSSIPIMSPALIQATIGMTWWNYIQAFLGAGAWLLFIFFAWRIGTSLLA